MASLIRIEERGPTPGVMKSKHNAMSKEAWSDVGAVFGVEMLPRRFTAAGASELNYAPRSAAYTAQKQAIYGHTKPFVYSGDSEQRAKSFNVRTTRDLAVVSTGAGNINLSGRSHEFRRVSRREANDLAEVWVEGYDDQLSRISGSTTTDI